MIGRKLIDTFKKRWKFYLAGYVIGYIYPMGIDETIDYYHLMPIKLFSIVFGIIVGTTFFYGSKRVPIYEIPLRIAKYALPGIGIIIIAVLLEDYFRAKGIDISIFIGLPKN